MHDPMVVAFTIPRPWPQRQARLFGTERWRFAGKFWNIAGRGIYWPSVVTVWHVEPHGADALRGECKDTHWHWHVHHWKIQVHPLQHLRRRALTRCEWCGQRSHKSDPVNVSHQWDREPGHWWRGERGLFHQDCSAIDTAHRTCVCQRGPWEYELSGYAYGLCQNCGKRRAWLSDERRDPRNPREQSELLLASIPHGKRDPAKTAQTRAWWAEYRAQTKENAHG